MPGNDTTVHEAQDSDAAAWNAFIDASAEASPLARYEWRDVLRESYNLKTHYFIAERDGRVAGTLAAYETKGILGEKSFYSVRGGFVPGDAAAGSALLDRIQRSGEIAFWSRCVVGSGWTPLSDREPSQVRSTVQLTVEGDPDRIWSNLRDKARNMIRRAEKEQLRVVSGLDQVGILAEQYQSNMLRLGVPIHSRRYFQSAVQHLRAHSEILVAWRERTPIASMLLHYGRDVACYPVQNAVLEYRALAPVQLLIWHAMKCCAARNIRLLDMGESRQASPVFQSKVNFGGTPRDVFYYELPPATGHRAPGGVLAQTLRRGAHVADTWLASRSPLSLRRRFAQKSLARGRVM